MRVGEAWGGYLLWFAAAVTYPVVAGTADVFPSGSGGVAYGLATYLWVCGLAILGASAAYLQEVASSHGKFTALLMMAELATAVLVGLCAFWLGEAEALDLRLTAVGIAAGGWLGKTAMQKFANK